jgi:hypothetical protein
MEEKKDEGKGGESIPASPNRILTGKFGRQHVVKRRKNWPTGENSQKMKHLRPKTPMKNPCHFLPKGKNEMSN